MLVDVDPLRMIIIFFLKVRDSRSHQQFSSVFCPSSFSFSFTLLFVVHVFGLFDLLILPRKEKNKKQEIRNPKNQIQMIIFNSRYNTYSVDLFFATTTAAPFTTTTTTTRKRCWTDQVNDIKRLERCRPTSFHVRLPSFNRRVLSI